VIDTARIKRIFDKPELARLIKRLKTHYEHQASVTTIALPSPTLEERKAVANLLGKRVSRARSIRITISELETVIQNGKLAPDLRSLVETLQGPLRNLVTEKAIQQQSWQAVYDNVKTASSEIENETWDIENWLAQIAKTGLLKRLAKGDPNTALQLLQQTLSVLRTLPGKGQTLSTLAANSLGDAHGLDRGRPVATLVKRAIAHSELNTDSEEEERDREIWANAGILVGGAITSQVLVLNLAVAGKSYSAQILNQAKHHGQPLWLTLRQLVLDTPPWQLEQRTVYVCENPAIIAEAAEHLGANCPPMVCSYGQSGAAFNYLLQHLQDAGARLVYHGDYDWPGITIANSIMQRFAVKPWLFDETAYRLGAKHGKLRLDGKLVNARWDSKLSLAMGEIGLAVPEELVLTQLLDSLSIME
jgi:uncharacterized protein (TIGR02679 family)